MKPNELIAICEAAYGSEWKYALADAVDISREMLWRYANGKNKINETIATKIRRICYAKINRNIAMQQRALERYFKKAA